MMITNKILLLVVFLCLLTKFSDLYGQSAPSFGPVPLTEGSLYTTESISGTYSVWLKTGNGPTDVISNPIIITEGIDFFESTSEQSVFDLMNSNEGANLSSRLRQAGFDIVILNYGDSGIEIQKNAFLLATLIGVINSFPNVNDEIIVAGVSMGGLVARYALAFMEANAINHNTSTYISFDSPHKGAYFPITLQMLLQNVDLSGLSLYTNCEDVLDSGLVDGILDELMINGPNAPASKQMLLLNNTATNIDGFALTFDAATEFQSFYDELEGLTPTGYPQLTRNIAISNGSKGGQLNSTNDLDANFSLNYNNTGSITIGSTTVASATVNFDLTLGELYPTYFNGTTGFFYKDLDLSVNQGQLPPFSCLDPEFFFPAISPVGHQHYANGAGGYINWFQEVTDELNILAIPGLTINNSIGNVNFIPTSSGLGVDDGVNTSNPIVSKDYYTNSDLNYDIPFDRYYAPIDENQFHVDVSIINANWLLSMATEPDLWLVDGTIKNYNFGGNTSDLIFRDINISDGGQLNINVQKRVDNYNRNSSLLGTSALNMQVPFPEAGSNFFVKTMTTNPVAITIDNDGLLELGDFSSTGDLLIESGSVVHVKDLATLRVAGGSKLIIAEGAKLIIDEGANIDLFWAASSIEIHGELEVNGQFNFDGQGFFNFHETSTFTLNADAFVLNGEGKNIKFIELNGDIFLNIPSGSDLELSNGLVEFNGSSGFKVERGSVDISNVTFEDDSDAVIGLEVNRCTGFNMFNTDFTNISQGVVIHGMDSDISFNFQYNQFLSERAFTNLTIRDAGTNPILIRESDFITENKVTFHAIEVGNSPLVRISSCNLLSNISDFPHEKIGKGISINAVNQLIVGATEVDNFNIGIDGFDWTERNNVSLIAGSTISNSEKGVYINGGLDGVGLRGWGRVTMDCAKLIDNTVGIEGVDVLLNIDAYMHCDCVEGDEYLRSNTFIKGSGTELFFDICYVQRDDIDFVSATGNYWEINGSPGANLPDYLIKDDCGVSASDIPLDQTLAVFNEPNNCPVSPPVVGNPGPGPIDNSARDCGLESGGVKLDQDLIEGVSYIQSGDILLAESLLGPLAALSDGFRVQSDQYCRDRIDVARTYSIGSGDVDDYKSGMMIAEESAYDQLDYNKAERVVEGILIYPNPANHLINIDTQHSIAKIDFYNSMGQLIYTVTPKVTQVKIDIDSNEWREGVYYAHFEFVENRRTVTKRLVVLH